MAASKFTPEITTRFVILVESGLSTRDASRKVGVSEKTIKSWMTKGRKNGSSKYREFVDEVEAARQKAASIEIPGTEDELRLATWKAVQQGSVQAMKLYFEMIRGDSESVDESDPLAALGDPVGR